MFLPPLQPTGSLVQATYTRVGLRGSKDSSAQLRPRGQAVQHKTRYHRFFLHTGTARIYAPNVSLSLDIATSSSVDKDLFVRLRSLSAGMAGGNGVLI